VSVEPIPDDLIGLFRLVPEKAVTAALNDCQFGVWNVIAEVLRRDDVVAGVGISFIVAADKN
jgi:hypothetical protein